MKKNMFFRLLIGMMALLMILTAVSCNLDDSDPQQEKSTTTTTTADPSDNGGDDPAPPATIVINVVNGTFSDGSIAKELEVGSMAFVTLRANEAPDGMEFSHWTDASGKRLGNNISLMIKPTADNTYTANYMVEVPKATVKAINGTFSNGKSEMNAPIGVETVITAKLASSGYTFSHWEDEAGNTVATTRKLTIVPKEGGATYRAYYQLYFSGDTANDNGKPIGAYWNAELQDGLNKIKNHRTQIGEGASEFFYITDPHWTGNAGYSPALITYLAQELDEYHVIFGGDVIERYNAVKEDAIEKEIKAFFYAFEGYTKIGERFRIMSTLGNHDRNRSSNCPDTNRLGITEKEAYELYYKRMEGWGVTYENDANRSYYDDAENKVRYIQFYFAGSRYGMKEDSYVDAAMAWAEETITELDDTWTVVLFTHGFFNAAEGDPAEITAKDVVVAERMLNLQKNADAEIAAWIVGHNHEDRNEILMTDDGQTKLRVVSMKTDASSYLGQMKNGTVTEQSFAFFQLDTKNKMLYGTRFGYGDDLVLPYGQDIDVKNENTMTLTELAERAPK